MSRTTLAVLITLIDISTDLEQKKKKRLKALYLLITGSTSSYPWYNKLRHKQMPILMVAQLKDHVIPLFKHLHPGMKGVFLFDQSSNHKAFPEDALVASKMNMNPTGIKDDDTIQGKFRQGYYYNPILETVVDHPFYVEADYDYIQEQKAYNDTRYKGLHPVQQVMKLREIRNKKHSDGSTKKYFKGIRRILQDRKALPRNNTSLKRYCGNVEVESHDCCAVHLLASHSDFKNQRSILAEVVEGEGFIFELYPKYHCECNWIERYWGASKR